LEINSVVHSLEDKMVKVPSGEIALRDDRKKTKWIAEIEAFSLSQYQVTQALYFEITQKSPSTFEGDRHPVEGVSWYDAIYFCNLLSKKSGFKQCYLIDNEGQEVSLNSQADGYRLPTDAEWEYACRAGTRAVRHGELDDIAWYKENSEHKTHEVGLKDPNSWGLYDMLGNVWEWCWDIYDKEVYGPYRVFRGGGWYDAARGCLASNRRRSHPTFAIDDLGFRVARSVYNLDLV
jgi:formylglycine-generating enzyme required for sulfatase activity